MNKGIVVLIVLLVLGLVFFMDQNGNLITSFATSQTEKGNVTTIVIRLLPFQKNYTSPDINIDLFPLSREIRQGDDIRVATRIDTNDVRTVGATISYTITNDEGKVVYQKSRTLMVYITASIKDTLRIRKTLAPGFYNVEVEVIYKNIKAVERDTFTVVAGPVEDAKTIEILIGNKEALLLFVLIISIIFLIFLWIKKRRVSEGEIHIGDYVKKIRENKIILFILPNKTYKIELLNINKNIASWFSKVLYISLSKPAESVIETLRKNNIDTKKFLFVDAVTKGVKASISDGGITYITPPKNFEKFKAELNQIVEKEKIQCVIFDSLTTLLLYQDENIVIRFTHDLITKLTVAHTSGEFICVLDNVSDHFIDSIALFADEVVNINLEEVGVKQVEPENKEMVIKLSKELSAIRQAHASKFISEQTYLNSKKRVESKLKRLGM